MLNQQPRVFSPDSRNIGGRQQILRQMLNHQTQLQNTKSCLNIKQHSQMLHRTPSPLYKLYDQFQDVLHTFKRVQQIKNQKPRIPKEQPPSSKERKDTKLRDHLKNVFASQQRMNAPTTLLQRKKNKNDYLVYPAFFFRRVEKAPQKAKSMLTNSFEIDWKRVARHLPRYKEGEPDNFKQQVSKLLIDNRIFSDDDHAFLICLLSSVNMQVDQAEILRLFQEIIQ